jgi:hypothetical protein
LLDCLYLLAKLDQFAGHIVERYGFA